MNQTISSLVDSIAPVDKSAEEAALAHLNQLTKPPGSLGKLEALAVKLAGVSGKVMSSYPARAVVVMAGDHGVCEEGISAFPSEVTAQMVSNFLNGGAAVNVLARQADAEVLCVDIGVQTDLQHPGLISKKIRYGTANMVKEPAMTREEAEAAIMAGAEVARSAFSRGVRLFVTGEMGIGNTTASAAVMSGLTGISTRESVGRGTGIDDDGLRLKIITVDRAFELHKPNGHDPVDVLSKVGGLEIAGLTGVILAAAALRCPVIIDGFISSAAALAAAKLAPDAVQYMIASHVSQEPGHVHLLKELGLEPMLHLDMRLGEGTGGVLAIHLVDAACKIMAEMATFTSAGVSSASDGTAPSPEGEAR